MDSVDIGYTIARAIARVLFVSLGFLFPAIYLVTFFIACQRRKDSQLREIARKTWGISLAFIRTPTVLGLLLLLFLAYALGWGVWRFTPEDKQEGIYNYVDVLTTMFYPCLAVFWLRKLYDRWLTLKERSLPVKNWTYWKIAIVAGFAVGFNKLVPDIYGMFFVFYPLVALRADLTLAFLVSGKGNLYEAAKCSFNRVHGRFWELARLYCLLGLTAFAWRPLRDYVVGFDFTQVSAQPFCLTLMDAGVDFAFTSGFLLLDSLFLLRGLEFLEAYGLEETSAH